MDDETREQIRTIVEAGLKRLNEAIEIMDKYGTSFPGHCILIQADKWNEIRAALISARDGEDE